MSLYQYKCAECDEISFQQMDKDLVLDEIECPKCGHPHAKRIFVKRMAVANLLGQQSNNPARAFKARLARREERLAEKYNEGELSSEQIEKFHTLSKIITGGEF